MSDTSRSRDHSESVSNLSVGEILSILVHLSFVTLVVYTQTGSHLLTGAVTFCVGLILVWRCS
ncbi:hypothetical protein [Halospeciosus flavus]|uniref:Uncharacterized protein n=1 Tax=Halospeciosus flavus TaxID=3032283 RepID=A0ABD5Z8D9_9EURY|nr:hypothetical protein [Halospeciosus flavus]